MRPTRSCGRARATRATARCSTSAATSRSATATSSTLLLDVAGHRAACATSSGRRRRRRSTSAASTPTRRKFQAAVGLGAVRPAARGPRAHGRLLPRAPRALPATRPSRTSPRRYDRRASRSCVCARARTPRRSTPRSGGSSIAAGSCSAPRSRRSSRSSPRRPARRTRSASAPAPTRSRSSSRALGIGPGDEVITTPLSAAYTALAIMMAGARPVFADIDPRPPHARSGAPSRRAITPRTARHPAGAPLRPAGRHGARSRRSPARHGLALVEDCCQAHLATCGGRPVGTFGVGGAFSFYPTKNLGALGDGGAVVTSDAALADAREAAAQRRPDGPVPSRRGRRQQPARRDPGGHPARAPAASCRRGPRSGAALAARVPRASSAGARHRRAARVRRRARLPPVPGAVARERDALQAHLARRGIETLIHYPVPISAPAGAGRRAARPRARSPTASAARSSRCRCYPSLPDAQAVEVAAAVRRVPTADSRKDCTTCAR